jgi:hypothetical protein
VDSIWRAYDPSLRLDLIEPRLRPRDKLMIEWR